MESSSGGHNLPKIQIFRPTMDEFKDFSRYIEFIELQGAHKSGLAKVIPPKEWCPRRSGYNKIDLTIPAPILQSVSGNKGLYTTYNIQQKPMQLRDFEKLANDDRHRTPHHSDFDELERKFWKNVTFNAPIYGADISGSLYDKDQTIWNINRLGSVLDLVSSDYSVTIEGVNTAYLYFGMWKTSFCWHTEDMDLYSINYLHYGAPKSWYAIPPEHGRRLERLAAGFFPNEVKACPAFLRHKTTHISPHVLRRYSIPFNRITQEAGEFMITFPYSYHAGFNHGYNCAESTNFASLRWIEYGKRCLQCVCKNDMVHISMDCFIKKYQPDRYDLWLAGLDYGAHPEDDQSKLYSSNAAARSTNSIQEGSKTHRVSRRHPVIAQALPEKDAASTSEECVAVTTEIIQDIRAEEETKTNRNSTIRLTEESLKRKLSREMKKEKRAKKTQNVDPEGVVCDPVETEALDEDDRPCSVSKVNCAGKIPIVGDGPNSEILSPDHSYTAATLSKTSSEDGSIMSSCSAAALGISVTTEPLSSSSQAALPLQDYDFASSCSSSAAFNIHGYLTDPQISGSLFSSAKSSRTVGSCSLSETSASAATLTGSNISESLELDPLLPELKEEDLLLISEDLLNADIVEVFDSGTKEVVNAIVESRPPQLTSSATRDPMKKQFSKQQDQKLDKGNRRESSIEGETALTNIQWTCPQLSSVSELLRFLPENSAAEIEFNRWAGQNEPFCCVCSLLGQNFKKAADISSDADDSGDSVASRPRASKPLMSKTMLGLQPTYVCAADRGPVSGSFDNWSNLTSAETTDKSCGESLLLVCSRCYVCVHALCYGETKTLSSKSSTDWTCDRCLGGTFADACCLCMLRGGALKRTTAGHWVHLVCALAIGEAGLEHMPSSVVPNNVELVRKKQSCAYCHSLTAGQPSMANGQHGACLECATEGCSGSFHVTCALTAGLKFHISDAQGRLRFAVRCENHADEEEPSKVPVPSISRGDHVIAKHKNRRYYRCLVIGFHRHLFFRVAFNDGTFSNDTFPGDIEWPQCSAEAPPAINSPIKVRWSDGLLYDATFKGTNDVSLYQVQFEDGSVLNLERKDIWSENEELPKKVVSRMSVATETRHNLFRDEQTELSSRTRSVKLCYIRDRNFVNP